jgi:hypothetical protein
MCTPLGDSAASLGCSAVLRCAEQSDCEGGAVCCVTRLDSGVVLPDSGQYASQCTTSTCTGSVMCDPDADDCMCTTLMQLGGATRDASYYVCAP